MPALKTPRTPGGGPPAGGGSKGEKRGGSLTAAEKLACKEKGLCMRHQTGVCAQGAKCPFKHELLKGRKRAKAGDVAAPSAGPPIPPPTLRLCQVGQQ